MPQHLLEKFITDERSALAVAKALKVTVLYMTNASLFVKMRDAAKRPARDIAYGFEELSSNAPVRVVYFCKEEVAHSPKLFAQYDAERAHIFKKRKPAK